MEDENYEMMFKVVLVGDSFVGKTNHLKYENLPQVGNFCF